MEILETSRLILREFSPADADALAQILSDPETMRFYPAPKDWAAVEQWIERNRLSYRKHGHGLWAMILKTSGDLIGDCGLTIQRIGEADEVEIGYHVRRDLWRRGLASEAAAACRDFGFAHLPLEQLVSIIRPENMPSRGVAEKIGMSIWKGVNWAGLPHFVYRISRPQSVGVHSQ